VSSPDSLVKAYAPVASMPGHYGFSVQYQPGRTVDELAQAGLFPHKQVTYAPDIALMNAALPLGYKVALLPTPLEGPGYHHDLEVRDANTDAVLSTLPLDLAVVMSSVFATGRRTNPFPVP
jgi:hypothetical protein